MKFYNQEKGVSLVTTIIIVSLLTTLCIVTLSMDISTNKISANHIDSAQAFWLAEAGLEKGIHWLRNQASPPGGTTPFTQFDHLSLGGGTYTVIIDPDDGNTSTYLKRYYILSTGTIATISRNLEVLVSMNTFNQFGYATGDEGPGTIWFTTGDQISGPMHSNDVIAIRGTPTFTGRVTSSASSFLEGTGYDPVFTEGYQLNAPLIVFPDQSAIANNYASMNDDPMPLIIDAQEGREASVEFNSNGTITYSVWHWVNGDKVFDIEDTIESIDDLNGIIWVDGNVEVKGTVNGQVSLVATHGISITGDVNYLDSGVNGRPNHSCTDYLGLISMTDVVIADVAENHTDVIISAAVLALDESFTVENYTSGSYRGYIHLWGSLSQKMRGPVGTIQQFSMTGYNKDYNYDDRFLNVSPPYFPTTGGYEITSWKENVN